MNEHYIPNMAITTKTDFEAWIPVGARMTIVEVIGGQPTLYSGVRTLYPETSCDDPDALSDLYFFFMRPDNPDKHDDIHAFGDRNIDKHRNESFVFRYEEPAKNYVAYIASKNAPKKEWEPPVVTPTRHNPTL